MPRTWKTNRGVEEQQSRLKMEHLLGQWQESMVSAMLPGAQIGYFNWGGQTLL